MTIVVDQNILYAEEAFAQFGEVRTVAGEDITREILDDVDVLIVRSVTKVNRSLLEGTPIRFVGTATIGTDHIDLPYLAERNIPLADAAGAGARSVAEHILASLLLLQQRGICNLAESRLGIIGVGAIGQMTSQLAESIGIRTILYDPPRAQEEESFRSVSFEEITNADILSLSVPLTATGEHPTSKMVDRQFLEQLNRGSVIINTARGGVIDSAALAAALESGQVTAAVLDVWEGEPALDLSLLSQAEIATPHIAGYSRDAKAGGTIMMRTALIAFLETEEGKDLMTGSNLFGNGGEKAEEDSVGWRLAHHLPELAGTIDIGEGKGLEGICEGVLGAYNPDVENELFREEIDRIARSRNDDLRELGIACYHRHRKNYPARREFTAWKIRGKDRETLVRLEGLGFRID